MSEVPCHRTQMGQHFYGVTVPALVRELGRLNDNLERLVARVERDGEGSDEVQTGPKAEPRR